MNDYMKEIITRITSILLAILFFMVGTYFYVINSNNYAYASNLLNNLESVIVSDSTFNLARVDDYSGLNGTEYSFIITNNNSKEQNYTIRLIDDYFNRYDNNNLIDNKYIRYIIQYNNGEYSDITTLSNDGSLGTIKIKGNDSLYLTFKLWISDTYTKDYNYHGNLVMFLNK